MDEIGDTNEPINRMMLGNFLNWNYREMSWFFTTCKFPFKLNQLRFVYDHPDMEYGPIIKVGSQENLSAMSFPPLSFAEIDFSQTNDLKGISIAAVTFNRDKTYELLQDLAKGTCLIPGDPRQVITSLEPAILTHIRKIYPSIKRLSLENNISPGPLFGMTRYYRFLTDYQDIPESEIFPKVMERFGLKIG